MGIELRNMMKSGDYILIGVIGFAFFCSVFFVQRIAEEGMLVSVSVDGNLLYRLPINTDKSVTIDGPIGRTTIVIQNRNVWIVDAPCPHKTCMRMGKIRFGRETIVCIPNRLLIRIEGGSDLDIDGVTM
jgi:hypothetical protein